MEKIGLAVALVGHAGLLGAFYLGILNAEEPLKRPSSISVDIVADVADISSAPDAIQEEPAPAAEAPEEVIEETDVSEPEPTPPPPESKKPTPKPEKAKKPPKEKPKPKPKKKKSQTPKKSKKKGIDKSFESLFDGKGKAEGTPATKTASQLKRSITVSLRSQVGRFFKRCAPLGVDVNKITTAATLNLTKTGSLTSITNVSQRGINASNRPQAQLHKDCVNDAIRQAAPFKNLPKENYAVWKKWPMEFNTK